MLMVKDTTAYRAETVTVYTIVTPKWSETMMTMSGITLDAVTVRYCSQGFTLLE